VATKDIFNEFKFFGDRLCLLCRFIVDGAIEKMELVTFGLNLFEKKNK